MDKNLFSKLQYVKIPHHASTSSDILLSLIGNAAEHSDMSLEERKNLVSVSTSFHCGRIDLPCETVLNAYRNYSDKIVLTGNEENKHRCGISVVSYRLFPFSIIGNRELYDATVWYHNIK